MNVRRRLFNPVSAHVLMVSFLLGGMGALLMGLQQSLASVEESVRKELKVVLILQSTVSDVMAEKWASSLTALDPEITAVEFTSKAKAIQRAQANPLLAKSLMLLSENPFPASVELRYKDLAWLGRDEPTAPVRGEALIQSMKWDAQARSIFLSIHEWRSWLMRFSAFAFMMLVVWGFFGIYRFLALKAPLADLFVQLGLGIIGGSLAILTWGLSLRQVGADAALYSPETVSFWPLVTAIMAALATFGWQFPTLHED